MKKFLILFLPIILFFSAGCGEEKNNSVEKNSAESKTAEKISPENNSDKKILVAYFSHAGENYKVGVIEKGNTKIVAEMIAEKTGADIFEIKPVKNYPASYQECTELAKTEKEKNTRPEIVGRVENFNQYDIIFLGYPIWWNDLPMAVYTFLEQEDFSKKIIVPFCTHEGSNLGGTENFIAEKTKAKVLNGLAVRGSVAQNEKNAAQKEVENWLYDLEAVLKNS